MEAIMNLARSNQAAAFAIVAGGIIGASLSISFLGSGDVPAPDPVVVSAPGPVVVPSAPVEEAASSGQASGFDLQQNYPNPFNPETTIPFILHEGLFAEGLPAQVSMRIFNVLTAPIASPVALGHSSGEGVELIELEYTQPGTYEAFWDGTDQSGREVASGFYYVQLKVNGRLEMGRLYRAMVPAPDPVVVPALTLEDRFGVEIESLQNRERTAVEVAEAYVRLATGNIRPISQ
jgi:hypothetical protein